MVIKTHKVLLRLPCSSTNWNLERPLDSKTRANFHFLRILKKSTPRKTPLYFFVSRPWLTDVMQLTLTLKMTTAQVVETSVTVNNNSPIQDYVHPDDQTQPFVLFSWEKLARSFLLKEVKPFLDHKIIKFLTADTLFATQRHFHQNLSGREQLRVRDLTAGFSRILKNQTARKASLYYWFTR